MPGTLMTNLQLATGCPRKARSHRCFGCPSAPPGTAPRIAAPPPGRAAAADLGQVMRGQAAAAGDVQPLALLVGQHHGAELKANQLARLRRHPVQHFLKGLGGVDRAGDLTHGRHPRPQAAKTASSPAATFTSVGAPPSPSSDGPRSPPGSRPPNGPSPADVRVKRSGVARCEVEVFDVHT